MHTTESHHTVSHITLSEPTLVTTHSLNTSHHLISNSTRPAGYSPCLCLVADASSARAHQTDFVAGPASQAFSAHTTSELLPAAHLIVAAFAKLSPQTSLKDLTHASERDEDMNIFGRSEAERQEQMTNRLWLASQQ